MANTLTRTPTRSSQISYPNGKPHEGDLKGAAKRQTLPLAYDKAPWYLRVPFTMKNPQPPQGTLDDASIMPDTTANLFSLLTYAWVLPILNLGYARPLETTDLWKLDDSRAAGLYADRILESFDRRCKAADEYNARLAAGDISPRWLRKIWWGIRGSYERRERQWRQKEGKKKPSLAFAMNDAVKWSFWSGGLLKVVADMAQITSPLVIKAIIQYAAECYEIRKLHPTAPTPSVGRGVGLAITLFLMQSIASQGLQHAFHRSLGTGVLLRAGLITAIYRRSLRFTARARSQLPNGKIVNHISTDVSRIDFCCGFFHFAWTAPIQMVVCLILLLLNLGVSALAGFALFLLITPAMTKVMGQLTKLRQKSMVWTDKRAKLLQELLGGIRVVKFFAWEIPFLKRIGEYRTKELHYIRMLLVIRSLNNSFAFSLPVLSAVVAFIMYSVMGHDLRPDVIFASLALFQLLRLPLLLLPIALGTIADAANAIGRLTDVFTAELLDEPHVIDPALPVAISVRNASFTWDGAPPLEVSGSSGEKKAGAQKREEKKEAKRLHAVVDASSDMTPPVKEKTEDEGEAFKLNNINLEIPRGQLCAIVGPVGSGKSSLLQGILGEMRRTEGEVMFGGSVSYAAQSAWIQSCSIRDNILFGREFDEEKY